MDDTDAFERQVVGQIQRFVGPARPVDDAAIFRSITAATRSPKGRFQHIFSAARFLVAGLVVALFGGFLLVAQPVDLRESDVPWAESDAGAPRPLPSSGAIEPGRYFIPWGPTRIEPTIPAGPTRPYMNNPAGWWSNDALYCSSHASVCIVNPSTGAWIDVHDVASVATAACVETPDLVAVGPTAEDLTTALADQVGLDVSGPTDVTLGGYPAQRFVIVNPWPRTTPSCPGREGHTQVWENADGSGLGLREGMTVTVHVVDVDGQRLVVASGHRGAFDPEATAELGAELAGIVASIDIEPADPRSRTAAPSPLPPPSPGPRSSPPQAGAAWVFPPPGELEPGWYTAIVEGFPLGYRVPAPGWFGPGPRWLGSYLAKAGVVVRFSSPEQVYVDPCAHTLGPPVGPSAADLAAAIAAIPGTDATGPTDLSVSLRTSGQTVAKKVVVTVREDAPCGPGELGFRLWYDDGGGGTLPSSGRRWVKALGSRVSVWVFKPYVHGAPRFIVDAETVGDVSAELEEEIGQIVESIYYRGG